MDYQIERLHIYGDKHPSSNLKNKVVGWQFKNNVEIIDPVTKVKTKEPLKPFMINSLALTIERSRLVLSPFDETLHKQLVDYVVEKVTDAGVPKYTSKNEHFVDALGLAHLAFVLKFPDLTQAIKKIELSSKMAHSEVKLGLDRVNEELRGGSTTNPWGNLKQIGKGPGERPGDYQKWVQVPMKATPSKSLSRGSWGSRTSNRGLGGRSMW